MKNATIKHVLRILRKGGEESVSICDHFLINSFFFIEFHIFIIFSVLQRKVEGGKIWRHSFRGGFFSFFLVLFSL